MDQIDSEILELLKARPENYFGIADWEALAAKWKIRIKLPQTFRVPTLAELDALVPSSENKNKVLTFKDALFHGRAFAFLVPESLGGIECSFSIAGNIYSESFCNLKPGVYLVENKFFRRRHAAVSDPIVILSAVLLALKKQEEATGGRVKLTIKDKSGLTYLNGDVPLRWLTGVSMPIGD